MPANITKKIIMIGAPWLNFIDIFLILLEKYVYSKKCLKQRRQPPPSLQQSRRNFRAVIFSQPRGDRGATMHRRRWGTDFLSDCHNYFTS